MAKPSRRKPRRKKEVSSKITGRSAFEKALERHELLGSQGSAASIVKELQRRQQSDRSN
jgi:hypothetical protein